MDKGIKDTMQRAVFAAGEVLKRYYGKSLAVGHKSGQELVSSADTETEERILFFLLTDYPFNVFAEENGEIDNHSDYCWIIDPLDGTTNYLRQIPFFCVSIALYKGNQPEAAVIYQPISNELFYAEAGKGVYLNDKPLKREERNASILIDCNMGYGQWQKYLEALAGILPSYSNIRNLGSSALELAYLAASRLDCFITFGDQLYDIAAGVLLAREAGCVVSNWEGDRWKPEDRGLLAAPALLHQQIVDAMGHRNNNHK